MNTIEQYTDDQLNQYGNSLAVALGLKRDREHSDRWVTAWGTKTGKGLFLTLARMVNEPHGI